MKTYRRPDEAHCTAFQVTLHNVGAPSTGVTSTGRAWSDVESKDVPTGSTKLSLAHVPAHHIRESHAKVPITHREAQQRQMNHQKDFARFRATHTVGRKQCNTISGGNCPLLCEKGDLQTRQHERPPKTVPGKADSTEEVHQWQKV